MNRLILVYSVCSLDFEFSVQYGLKPTFFKFADVNKLFCLLFGA